MTLKELDALKGKVGKMEVHLAGIHNWIANQKSKLLAVKAKPTKAKK